MHAHSLPLVGHLSLHAACRDCVMGFTVTSHLSLFLRHANMGGGGRARDEGLYAPQAGGHQGKLQRLKVYSF